MRSIYKAFKKNRAIYLMMAPVMVCFFIFTVYPNVWIISLSFFRFNGILEPVWIGLENYERVFFRDPIFWRSMFNTFVFAIGKLAVELPLALALAILLNGKIFGRNFFRTVFFMPNVTSPAVMGLVFFFIFAAHQGILNGFLQFLNIIDSPIDWFGNANSAMIAMMSVSVWQNFGINMVLFLAALQGIPQDIYESGDLDGAVGLKRFWYLTMPLLSRMTQIIVMLAIIGSLRVFDIVQVMTGGAPGERTHVFMTYIFAFFFPAGAMGRGQPQIGYGSAMGVVGSIIIALVTLLYLWSSRRMDAKDY